MTKRNNRNTTGLRNKRKTTTNTKLMRSRRTRCCRRVRVQVQVWVHQVPVVSQLCVKVL